MPNNFVFEPDRAAKKIHISREFNAPIEKVWRAYTDPGLLDKWVGPKPWTAVAKTLDFTVGGIWLYAMVSPEGQKQWGTTMSLNQLDELLASEYILTC